MATRFLIIFLMLFASKSCHDLSRQNKNVGEWIFAACDEQATDAEYTTLVHELFEIEYPKDWKIENKLKQGLDISSVSFPDSLQRGFMLSVVPYKEMYLRKNPGVEYFRFESGAYQGFEAICFMRNDLWADKESNTVYWRGELKLVNKQRDQIFILVFGRRYDRTEEPDWCVFKRIIESLKIKS